MRAAAAGGRGGKGAWRGGKERLAIAISESWFSASQRISELLSQSENQWVVVNVMEANHMIRISES